MSTAPETSRVIRVSIDAAEWTALRRRALDLGVTVPALLAQLVRRELKKSATSEMENQ